jgi:diguanylate cyclase (GGDEF)-like protein
LPNRVAFYEQAERALQHAQAEAGSIAILYLDLDDFKLINDSLGHAAGDDLLVAVSDRIRACVRTTDLAARLGGDEFGVLLEPASEEEARAIAHRIVQALRSPFHIGGKEIFARSSIGVAVSQGEEDIERLIRDADVAMYAVKDDRKGRYEIFRPELHSAALERVELEAELKASIDSDDFVMHYQPIVEAESGRTVAVEALARWAHPERGLLGPNEFIEAAERTGLILPLGRLILEKAAREAVLIRASASSLRDLVLTVNISARQLMDAGIVDDVRNGLETSGLPPDALILEISENVVVREAEQSLRWLTGLRNLGVHLAIDDFGSGTTSLQHLKQFPIEILKIDRAFAIGLSGDPEHAAFLAAIHRLASALGLRCVFEGVETAEQARTLRMIGYEMLQGYAFTRPLPFDQIVELLSRDAPFAGLDVHQGAMAS